MQVFKLFFKILRDNKSAVIVSFVITIAVTSLFVSTGGSSANETEARPFIYISSQSDSVYAKGLEAYLNKKCSVVEVKEDVIEDALYYGSIYYALNIPSDFDTKLKNNETVTFDKKIVKATAASYLVDQYINDYMSALQSNVMYNTSLNEKQILELVNKNLANDVGEKIYGKESDSKVTLFFNFFAYTLTTSLIAGIGFTLLKVNSKVIKRRITAAPISNLSTNIQLILASIVYALVLGVLGVMVAFALNFEGMQAAEAKFMVLNVFVYLIPSLGLSYLIGTCIKSLEVQSGAANVIGLAFAFLGGSFVPQFMLSNELLRVSTFTPTYWFVRVNDELSQLNTLDWNSLQPIFSYMLIQIIFGITFFLIAILFMKQSRKNII